jgi:chromate reductase
MLGASPGQTGTAAAQQHLRNIISPQQMIVMGQPELYLHWKDGMIDSDAQVTDEAVKKRLDAFLDRFVLWVGRVGVKSA